MSVLVTGEIRRGIEAIRKRDPRAATALERWLGNLMQAHSERVLPVDAATADEWGRLDARGSLPVVEGLLAATAQVLQTEADPSEPPPLAHERVAERVPGSADASRDCAERARAMPSFSDTATTLGEEELRRELALQRFLRRDRPSGNEVGQQEGDAAPYIPLMVNFDLHRRKVFRVDAALSFCAQLRTMTSPT